MEGGILEDLTQPPPDDVWGWTTDPRHAPNDHQDLEIGFANGVPVSIGGHSLGLVDLISAVHTAACTHGVGRIDMLENRVVGIKTRELYEAPAATVLIQAHAELEAAVIDRGLWSYKKQVDQAYAGLWFSPLREALHASVESVQRFVNGKVTVRLYRGRSTVVARAIPDALYDKALSTYGTGDTFDHRAAEGWIALQSLPLTAFRSKHPVL
jgi:argininosuccinate synthase